LPGRRSAAPHPGPAPRSPPGSPGPRTCRRPIPSRPAWLHARLPRGVDSMTETPTRARAPRTRTAPEPIADVAVDALLDIVDDRAWLRADGYLPGPDDIPVALSQVRQLGLRRGDRITGFARTSAPRKPATLQVE